MDSTLATVGISVLGFLLFAAFRALGKSSPPLPPGPPRKFFIGNIQDVPEERFNWEAYAEMAKQYGPVMSLSTPPNTTVVILSRYTDALAMLEKKGSIYSNRPYVPMVTDVLGWKLLPTLLQNSTKEFKLFRKDFHEGAGTPALVAKFHPQLERQCTTLVRRLVAEPSQLKQHLYHHMGSSSLRLAYGYTALDKDDPLISMSTDAQEAFGEAINLGRFWVNLVPALHHIPEWLPGAAFHKWATEKRHLLPDMSNRAFDFVKGQMAAGNAEESFVATRLEKGVPPEELELLKNSAASFFVGGTDTTSCLLHFFFLAMLTWPPVLEKLQAEMDQVIGSGSGPDRLPTFQDQQKLPYLQAVIKELIRFHPIAPMGVAHCPSMDDVYNGYLIPKGSFVLTNLWAMFRDPEVYRNPDEFSPERFLGATPELDPKLIVYGFGRRSCPGRFLAGASVFITLATVIALFDIRPELDENSKPIIPSVRQVASGSMINALSEFPVKLESRCSKEKIMELCGWEI